jgi:hypothetical protein
MKRTIAIPATLLALALLACSLPSNAGTGGPPTPIPVGPTQPAGEPAPTATATALSTATAYPVVPISAVSVQLEGVAYKAYQMPGDPFRFVCQEPCKLDEQYIFAEYAGFKQAHAKLIELTGIDTLAELQPVDMHLDVYDSVCGDWPGGHAYIYAHEHRAFTCSDGPGYYPTLQEQIQAAATVDGQYFTVHEYMHTLFFGRLSGTFGSFSDPKAYFIHDYVVPVPSYAVGILDPAGFCSYRNELAPGDYGGWLISELCTQDSFQLADLARSLVALDDLYQSGGGQFAQPGYLHPAPTVAQYRDILNQLLGTDTTNAFAAACWPSGLFGNSYTPPAACASSSSGGSSDATATPVR